VPKVSDEHKERRREQILEGARRCFARHGYEGATVARLEEETGLSRGAIFNYFANKEAIFIALAAQLSDRMTEIWLGQGFRALLDAVAHEDPEWFAVQLEALRRFRTDPEFQAQARAQEEVWAETRDVRLERLREQGVRDDVPAPDVAVFLSLVVNGLALRMASGDPLPDLDAIGELVDTGVAARSTRKGPSEWPKTAPRTRRTQRSPRRSPAA